MATYIILSRFSPNSFREPAEFREVAATVSTRIREACPGIEWVSSYVTLGRYDVVDVVEAEDRALVEKAAMIIRGYGDAVTETLAATPWKEFLSRL